MILAEERTMSSTGSLSKNRRISQRRSAKRSVGVTCFKGALGLGANLAVSLLDLSESGVRMIIKTGLDKGQEVEIGLLGPGRSRPIKLLANVAWSVPAADGTFCVGACFQRRLAYADLLHLT
jgi:hypothetical protein